MRSPILASADPRPILDAAFGEDGEARISSLVDPCDRLAAVCMWYGFKPYESRVAEATQLYVDAALHCTAEDRRWVQGCVRQLVQQLDRQLATAFMPFIMLDDDYALVSTATLDYASLCPPPDDDPLFFVRDSIAMATGGAARQPVAVLSGLLTLGDPRVCELLEPLRERIPDEGLDPFTYATSNCFAICVFEFYASWARSLVDSRDANEEARFGSIMGGLVRLSRAAAEHAELGVRTGLRPFPVPVDDSPWPETRLISVGEAAESLSLSLYDIERRESAPRLAPHVLLALGLQPSTPMDEWLPLSTATPSDRGARRT